MNGSDRICSVCSQDADWVRVRMPNSEQMTYLCHRHYQSLQHRNPLLASYYEAMAAIAPMEMNSGSAMLSAHYPEANEATAYREPFRRP